MAGGAGNILRELSHYGDILAIVPFFLTFLYFYRLPKRTPLETFLLLFAASGFVLDIVFTLQRYGGV